jgi:uncharacterized protein (TIGR00297 family)
MLDNDSGAANPVTTLLTSEALVAIAVTTAFAGGAWLLRGVTTGGAIAGFAVALAIFAAAGPGAFAVLIAVFAVAWLTTRLGYRKKQALGTAENSHGRSASQVLANLAAGALFAVAARVTGQPVFLLAAIAALAEAAADTAASECGEALSDRAYLITSFRAVPAGTDGGISLPGTLAALVAAGSVAMIAAAAGVLAWAVTPFITAAGFAGTVIDSLLGATLERRGILGNNSVNFASTLAAGTIALLIRG